MKKEYLPIFFFLFLSAWTLTSALTRANGQVDESPKDPQPLLLLKDSQGKEQKLRSWKFTQGTRSLGWLDSQGNDSQPDKKHLLAEALEFREENSTGLVNGVVTLIPLDRLRSLEYSPGADSVTAKVATDKPNSSEVLKGSTKYRGINKIAIDAEVDKGSLGLAEVKFTGGTGKGIKGITFTDPKAGELLKGRKATVSITDKDQLVPMEVADLQPLYRLIAGGERRIPLLHFKKTLKIDVGQIKKISRMEGEEGTDLVWQVTMKDGEENLTLMQMVTIGERDAVLVGLVGTVTAGYELFRPDVIAAIEFDPPGEK